MRIKNTVSISILTMAMMPAAAMAATITGWDTTNVAVGGVVPDGSTGASVVYQDAGRTITNSQIAYTAPEANSPGIKVLSGTYDGTQNQEFDGCIMTSGTAVCDSGFQSGKRLKQQITGVGPTDLVFGVDTSDASTEDAIYQVYHRLINVTDQVLGGFTVELGTGVGDGFTRSATGDGLSFAQTVTFGPDKKPAFSQFPFGLFGSMDQPNPNPLELPGFFDTTSRAGFEVALGEDVMTSGAYYGGADNPFLGDWLAQGMVPEGLLWDYADGEADPLVMAWDNGEQWELRRGINDGLDGMIGTITADDVFALAAGDYALFDYDDLDGVMAYLSGIPLLEDVIEDLANLNLTYAILLGDDYAGDDFTLRVTSLHVAPIPLPAGAPLMIAAIGALGLVSRRRARRI